MIQRGPHDQARQVHHAFAVLPAAGRRVQEHEAQGGRRHIPQFQTIVADADRQAAAGEPRDEGAEQIACGQGVGHQGGAAGAIFERAVGLHVEAQPVAEGGQRAVEANPADIRITGRGRRRARGHGRGQRRGAG